ncbi:hypothetical protein NM688_g2 [Phlebia brevispora]|uniref:Uncharacterized protein n=1 Tax=Phlebia brevispora TaxID=194682 RepID=A0ACC1TFA5_9APHY|nr:hypothetical protein NM688_g2 [Phlebia brevispora]
MSFRWTTLPLGLKQSICLHLEGTALRTAPRNGFSGFRRTYTSAHPTARRSSLPARNMRRYLWLLPIGSGIALYLSPKPEPLPSTLLTSPNVIPCQEREPLPIVPTIFSPAEPHILSRILVFFRDKIWEPILTARRFLHLLYLFLPVLISSPMLLVGAPEERYAGDRWGAVWWYGYLTAQMERAGPTFIKLAQWAASRADLFPSMLCSRLGSLHSRGKAHSMEHTRRVIERVFQRPFEEVFEEFDDTPMGSGAIAQVYRATLKQDLIPPALLTPASRHSVRSPVDIATTILQPPPPAPSAAVAVKILHPQVEKLIRRDLQLMSFFAQVLTLIPGVQWLSLPEEVELFGQMMYEQLDLRGEGRNLTEFAKRFSGRNLPVTFPRPLETWSTKDVLVEEYQNALSLEDFLRNGGGPYNDMLAEVGLDAFLNMLLLDNFVHSDLHPGNIMIKFVKPPSTLLLLKNALKALLKSRESLTSAETNPSPQPDITTEMTVNGLRSLRNDPSAWREVLDTLHNEGYTPEIVFIDAGLVTTLNATDRRNFLDLFSAIAQFDGYRAGELMVERCRTPELAVEPETFALKMQHIVLNVKRKTFSLGQIMISDILQSVLKAVREHHVKLEADFVNTIISVLILEGIGRQLDPGLDLFKSALPILRQLGRHMGTQENIKQMEKGSLIPFLKVWLYVEARELASSALVDADELVKYDCTILAGTREPPIAMRMRGELRDPPPE